MNREQLKLALDELGISPREYSLHGDPRSDTLIIYQNYSHWEVFYLDERGRRELNKVFSSEEEACEFHYQQFQQAWKYRKPAPDNNN